MLRYASTPIQEISNEPLDIHRVKLLLKREDLNHPSISGNKWWKLKYNLQQAKENGHSTLLTFGGAYSNHIYATAAAAKQLGFESIGIIRGEKKLPLNHTLAFAESCGMNLHFVSREEYKRKMEADFINQLQLRFGDFYLIPEGGTNTLAVKGCAEFGELLTKEIEFDYLCLPIGTGATMAGIVAGVKNLKKTIGFSVLKGGSFLNNEVRSLLFDYDKTDFTTWEVNTDYHSGGYAKTNSELLEFKKSFEQTHNIPLDQVYTAKMMAGIFDLIKKGYFEKGSTVLAIHTGGLQGNYLNND